MAGCRGGGSTELISQVVVKKAAWLDVWLVKQLLEERVDWLVTLFGGF